MLFFLYVAAIATFVVRYKAVQSVLDTEDVSRFRVHSRVSLVLGIIASMGLSIVANFQVTEWGWLCQFHILITRNWGSHKQSRKKAVLTKNSNTTPSSEKGGSLPIMP